MTSTEEGVAASSMAEVRKTSLDKDLRKLEKFEEATRLASRQGYGVGAALLFLVTAGILASSQIGVAENGLLLIVAAVIGGYMALTIGANDVANNIGPRGRRARPNDVGRPHHCGNLRMRGRPDRRQ